MNYNLNGKIFAADDRSIHPDNRSFRYGEGLFETIRLFNADLPLWEAHWNRLNESLPKLYFTLPVHFTKEFLKQEVLSLAKKNKCSDLARVRITVFKGEGGLWDVPSSIFNYLIQCWPLEKKLFSLNENGLDIGLFEDGWKSCDVFSNLKSNNYQLYAMAAQYAKQNRWNEALVLNQHQRVCDATIANVFFVKNHVLHTPQLSEAAVNGVMRNYLIQQLVKTGTRVEEGTYAVSEFQNADELFLTNAIYGIRWVKQFGHKVYSYHKSAEIFQQYISPLFG